MTITERMFTLLEEKNKKSVDLASILNVGTGQISTWKKRNTDPPAKYIASICEFLDVSTEFLLTGTDNNQNHIELTNNDQELLDLFHQLPERNQIKLIGYVERMLDDLFGETIKSQNSEDNYDWVDWDKIMNGEPSVAADELKKTGTENTGK